MTPSNDDSLKEVVRDYFERRGPAFDRSYDATLPLRRRLTDRLFRGILQDRLSLVVNAASAPGITVLDVGTGSGRVLCEMVRRGAGRGVGVDLSPAMIERGRHVAEAQGVADLVQWVVGDYLEWSSGETFDVVMSTGFTEYVADPLPYLKRMLEQCRGTAWIGFARRWEVRVPFRIARMVAERGYVRFFARAEIVELFRAAGDLRYLGIIDLGRDFMAVYDARSARLAASAQSRHRGQ